MKPLRIAQIAPYWMTVPPHDYGGTERVVSYITEALIARGHDVTLFAAPGSITQATLVSPVPASHVAKIQSYADDAFDAINTAVCEAVFAQAGSFDIIHSHASHWAFPFAAQSNTPTIHTVHNQLPRASATENLQYAKYRELNFVSISHEFQTHMDLNWVATVYHGIPLERFPFSPGGGDHLLWLGRVSKNKGELDAMEAAKHAGEKLVLAASVHEKTRGYFEAEVQPRLTHDIRVVQNIQFEETASYYGEAKAFLFPIAWREPFGLVMIEAMACGTPVIAYNRGSVPEIVKDGVTGFIIDPDASDRPGKGSWIIKQQGIEGFVEAIHRIGEIDRAACRRHVAEHFTVEMMVDGYEKVCRQVGGW